MNWTFWISLYILIGICFAASIYFLLKYGTHSGGKLKKKDKSYVFLTVLVWPLALVQMIIAKNGGINNG